MNIRQLIVVCRHHRRGFVFGILERLYDHEHDNCEDDGDGHDWSMTQHYGRS